MEIACLQPNLSLREQKAWGWPRRTRKAPGRSSKGMKGCMAQCSNSAQSRPESFAGPLWKNKFVAYLPIPALADAAPHRQSVAADRDALLHHRVARRVCRRPPAASLAALPARNRKEAVPDRGFGGFSERRAIASESDSDSRPGLVSRNSGIQRFNRVGTPAH